MNGTAKGLIAIMAVVVIVVGAAVLVSNDSEEDSDGFQPQPPVSGVWTYTAITQSAQNDTVFYDGTLKIVMDDNALVTYDKNVVKTLASELSEDELELKLASIGKHNTGSDSSEGLYWPPETDPVYIIRNSFDFVDGYSSNGTTDVTNGDEDVSVYLFEKDGRTLYVATSGVIYAVADTTGETRMVFVLDGWRFD